MAEEAALTRRIDEIDFDAGRPAEARTQESAGLRANRHTLRQEIEGIVPGFMWLVSRPPTAISPVPGSVELVQPVLCPTERGPLRNQWIVDKSRQLKAAGNPHHTKTTANLARCSEAHFRGLVAKASKPSDKAAKKAASRPQAQVSIKNFSWGAPPSGGKA